MKFRGGLRILAQCDETVEVKKKIKLKIKNCVT